MLPVCYLADIGNMSVCSSHEALKVSFVDSYFSFGSCRVADTHQLHPVCTSQYCDVGSELSICVGQSQSSSSQSLQPS